MEQKNTQEKKSKTVDAGFTDSDNSKIQDIKNVLNIPIENVSEKVDENTFEKSDPFGGNDAFEEDSDFEELGLDSLLDEDGKGVDSLFEDTEALSEMVVELLDLGMNYTSQAISTEWGEDEKYSIPESRKKKLRKPLAKLLEKRAPKVSPELAFMVFAIAIYSPQLIKAYQVRRKKLAEDSKPVNVPFPQPSDPAVPTPITMEVDETDEYEDMLKEMHKSSVVSPPLQAPINTQNIVTNEKPKKRKAGRPKGAKDSVKRKAKSIPTEPKGKKGKGKK